MNNNSSFPDSQRAAHSFTLAPFMAPTAQTLPEPAGLNGFSMIQDDEWFPIEQPHMYAGNDRMWHYDLHDSYQPHDNMYDQFFQSDWYPSGEPHHFGPDPPQLPETNFSLGTPNGFANEYLYSPVEPAPSCDKGFPALSTYHSDKGTAVDVLEDAKSAEALDTVDSSLFDKEKQAKAVIKKQRSQDSVTKQMGESIEIVQTATGLQFGGVYWTSPADDETIPSSPLEINARIDALTRAIQNKENCREKTTTGQYRNRWSAESTYYSQEAFKAAARELVLAMIDIHQNGWTKTIYDKGERENCQATMFYTFEDRFEALRELLHCSKTTCQDILKGTRFHTVIGNPRTLTLRTATNKAANAHKADLIAKGKESPNSEEHSDSEGNANSEGKFNSESNPEKSSETAKASGSKKRSYEDVLEAGERSDAKPPRPKAAAKRRRQT